MLQSVTSLVTPGHDFPPDGTPDNADFRAAASPTVQNTLVYTPAEITGTEIDWTAAKTFYKTLTGSVVFTFTGQAAGHVIDVVLDSGAGSFTVTWPTVKWAGGSAPTMTATAARWDIFRFRYVDGNLLGEVVAQNMS